MNLIEVANVHGFIDEQMKKGGIIIRTTFITNGEEKRNSITKKHKRHCLPGGCCYLSVISGTACTTF